MPWPYSVGGCIRYGRDNDVRLLSSDAKSQASYDSFSLNAITQGLDPRGVALTIGLGGS